jgi:uncharacterized membrane protein YeaQ/YmgE (transglycosylase-associated protein family)
MSSDRLAGVIVTGRARRTACQPAIARQPLHPAGFIYSVLGAMLLIYIARLLNLI